MAPLLVTQRATTILAGDFQYNPGWNRFFAISPPSIVEAFQEIVPQHMVSAVPTSSQLTWINEQGYLGALDHILTTKQDPPVELTVCMEVPFPSNHLPILAELKGLTRASVPPAMSAKGRYWVPRFPDESQLDMFREHFDQAYPATRTPSLDADLQSFFNSVLSSLEAAFGPPADYVAIPRLVQNAPEMFRKCIHQRPNWSHSIEETRKVAKIKARIQADWDIVDVVRHLRASPISAWCVTGSPAPAKRHYRLVTQAALTSRLEPTYAAGENTPTELLGAVGVDQFCQWHLAPPCNSVHNKFNTGGSGSQRSYHHSTPRPEGHSERQPYLPFSTLDRVFSRGVA